MKKSYYKGALLISAGGFISKFLGALYRIPLAAFLGSDGIGIYQMVFPLYCMLLTLSSGGIASGIARMVASDGKSLFERSALKLYSAFGLAGAVLMFFLSSPLSALQGEGAVMSGCMLLCPSVFFVAVISVVRGYFQGKGDMYPTFLTEVSEQVIKVVSGTLLCYIFRGDAARGVAAAISAVTLSELFSAAIAVRCYLKSDRPAAPLYFNARRQFGRVLKFTFPLTLTALAMPLSQLLESIAVVALLRINGGDATSLWGIFSGCATTLVGLPASITYGLAAAGVPAIAPLAVKDMRAAKEQSAKAVALTVLISLPCAAALFVFSPLASRLIFGSLSEGERELLVTLVRIMSVNAVTISLVQTTSAILIALGKPHLSTLSQWISCTMRVALSAALAALPAISVLGAAISANVCYLIAVLINIWYIVRVRGNRNENYADRIRNKGRRPFAVGTKGA